MKTILRNIFLLILCFGIHFSFISAQNSLLGDGFGGRLWYQSYNYSVGSYSAYTVCGDSNQLYAWGSNGRGQLGDSSFMGKSIPVKTKKMTHVSYYTAGYFSAAIKSDSSAWVWGPNSGVAKKIHPAIKFVCAGASFTTLVGWDGSVWNLGSNAGGAFGNIDFKGGVSLDSAIQMSNITRAVRVSNTQRTNVILLSNGKVMTVGTSNGGSLGLGDTIGYTKLPKIIPDLKNIVDIKSTATFSIALDDKGDVYYWGSVIGMDSTMYSSPIKMKGLKDIVAISAKNDGYHALFLDKNENCYGMGYNGWGQIGTNNDSTYFVPQLVAKDVVEIMAGESFSYIIKSNAQLYAVGQSSGGSIWLGSPNVSSKVFKKVDMLEAPFELCPPKAVQSGVFLKRYLCKGDSFLFDGIYRKDSGMFYKTELTNGILDTLKTLQLIISPKHETKDTITLCEGEKFRVANTSYEPLEGLQVNYDNQYGCDSIVTYSFKYRLKARTTEKVTLCAGQSFNILGQNYMVQDSLIFHFPRPNYCDSIVTYFFTRKERLTSSEEIELCEGENFEVNGREYMVQDSLIFQFLRPGLCDSFVTYYFRRKMATRVNKEVNICQGDSFMDRGKYYSIDTNLTLRYPRAGDCDSIVVYHFTVLPYKKGTKTIEKCQNETIWYKNKEVSDTGFFSDTLSNILGCDSILVIHIINSQSFQCFPVQLYLPNTFTPNNDGYNDRFAPFGKNLSGITSNMKIYTRWGALVYHDDPLLNPWDGRINEQLNPEGTYFYQFDYWINNQAQKQIHGVVNLIR